MITKYLIIAVIISAILTVIIYKFCNRNTPDNIDNKENTRPIIQYLLLFIFFIVISYFIIYYFKKDTLKDTSSKHDILTNLPDW